MILASHGIIGSQILQIDPDYLAFYDRVITAGGSLTTTEQTATQKLVTDLKGYGIWTKMKAIYPMVGASAAACSQNLKSSSFTGTFTATGWTFASTGVTPNGTSAYMDTAFNTNLNQTVNNFSMSVYVRSSFMSGFPADMGNSGAGLLPLTMIRTNGTARRDIFCWDYYTGRAYITTSDASGMWGSSRSGVNSWVSFERNTAVVRTTTGTETSLPNNNIYFACINDNGAPSSYSSREIAFGHMGDSLTNTEYNNFYTAVQAFQTTLSRNV